MGRHSHVTMINDGIVSRGIGGGELLLHSRSGKALKLEKGRPSCPCRFGKVYCFSTSAKHCQGCLCLVHLNPTRTHTQLPETGLVIVLRVRHTKKLVGRSVSAHGSSDPCWAILRSKAVLARAFPLTFSRRLLLYLSYGALFLALGASSRMVAIFLMVGCRASSE